MFERVCFALFYLCGIFLGYYLVMWVLGELGIRIPEMVLRVIWAMLVIVAVLMLYRLFKGAFGNLRLWPKDTTPPSVVFLIALGLGLASCQGNLRIVSQPGNPNTTAEIVKACTMDGVFKNFGGRLVLSMVPVPGVVTADQILAAGVDKVCSNPEVFSSDVSTVEWVIKNIRKN
jgi:hypothetical protein